MMKFNIKRQVKFLVMVFIKEKKHVNLINEWHVLYNDNKKV